MALIEHAKLSPSSAHRWVACPASLLAEQAIPSVPNEHAEAGTKGHSYLQYLLTGVGECTQLEDEELMLMLNKVADDIRVYAEDGDMLVEQRVSFGDEIGQPDILAFGTADVIVLAEGELQVHDLKCGRMAVSVKDNLQLIAYALGAMRLAHLMGNEVRVIRLVIHQPRIGGPLEHTMRVDELEAKALVMASAAAAALSPSRQGKYHPGTHCRYCRAALTCATLQETIAKEVAEDFSPLPEGTPYAEELSTSLELADIAMTWAKNVFRQAAAVSKNGVQLRGWKVVKGRKGRRVWSDQHKAAEFLKVVLSEEESRVVTLLSPAKAEVLLRKTRPGALEELKLLVDAEPGKPTLVRETDRRPTIRPKALKMYFDDRDDFVSLERDD